MTISDGDVQTLSDRAQAALAEDWDELLPDSQEADEYVRGIAEYVLADLNLHWSKLTTELSSPLDAQVLAIMERGVIAEVQSRAYRHMGSSEESWPALWRREYVTLRDKVARGDIVLEGVALTRTNACAYTSQPKVFTNDATDTTAETYLGDLL